MLAGDRQGRAAARRDPAVAGHRDPGRRVHQDHREEHHHPDQGLADLLDRRGQPDARSPCTCCRASANRPATTSRWPASTCPASTPAPRGMPQVEVSLRHRRQRHHARVGQGQEDRQGADASRSRPVPACPRRKSSRWCSDAEANREEDKKFHELVTARNQADAPDPRHAHRHQGARRQGAGRSDRRASKPR